MCDDVYVECVIIAYLRTCLKTAHENMEYFSGRSFSSSIVT